MRVERWFGMGLRPGRRACVGREADMASVLVAARVDVDDDGKSGAQDAGRATSAGTRMRTGTRCTILVKLPVAFSGGSIEYCAPDAGATLRRRLDLLVAERRPE